MSTLNEINDCWNKLSFQDRVCWLFQILGETLATSQPETTKVQKKLPFQEVSKAEPARISQKRSSTVRANTLTGSVQALYDEHPEAYAWSASEVAKVLGCRTEQVYKTTAWKLAKNERQTTNCETPNNNNTPNMFKQIRIDPMRLKHKVASVVSQDISAYYWSKEMWAQHLQCSVEVVELVFWEKIEKQRDRDQKAKALGNPRTFPARLESAATAPKEYRVLEEKNGPLCTTAKVMQLAETEGWPITHSSQLSLGYQSGYLSNRSKLGSEMVYQYLELLEYVEARLKSPQKRASCG